MPLRPAAPDGTPYFFLGYAHTPEKPWVEKLYREICAEILERTTLPVSVEVGFMDGSGIPLGGDWRDEVARALATCRVFVPLYSPRYFTREECGVEWHAFAQRLIDHRARHRDSDLRKSGCGECLGDVVGDGAGVAGQVRWGVVELVGEVVEGSGQFRGGWPVEGDGDGVVGVVDGSGSVEDVA